MKIINKKTILIALLITLFILGTQSSIMAEKPDELTIMGTDTSPIYSGAAVEAFEEEYGIDVEWQIVPYGDFFMQLTTSIGGGVPVDVYWTDTPWHAELGDMGMMIPFEDHYEEEELEELLARYFPASVEKLQSHGQTWAFPVITSPYYFWYNIEMLSDLGYEEAPETWDELREISLEAIEAGEADYGLLLGWDVGEALMTWFDKFLKLHEGDWINEDHTEFVFNSDEGVQALEYMIEMLEEGVVAEASLELGDWDSVYSFMAEETPFEINWGAVYPDIKDPEESAVADKYSTAILPGHNDIESYSSVGGGGWAVGTTTRSQEYAFKLMEYASGEMAAVGVLEDKGTEAVMPDVIDERDDLVDQEANPIYEKQLEHVGFRPGNFMTWYSYFRDEILAPRLHDALHGNLSAEEALDAAYEEAQQELEDRGI